MPFNPQRIKALVEFARTMPSAESLKEFLDREFGDDSKLRENLAVLFFCNFDFEEFFTRIDESCRQAYAAHLASLTRFNGLDLRNRQVPDEFLVGLNRQPQLDQLWLSNTLVTDSGLVHLKGLAQLRLLDLGNTQVTDAGLIHLCELSQLRTLDLSRTRVTDAGLVLLYGLRNLAVLNLRHACVSNDGVRKLKEALPNCWITAPGPAEEP